MSDVDRAQSFLRHERVHLRQRERMGDVGMAFVYLLPFFPLFLAYGGRARIEWEAYEENHHRDGRALFGLDRARALSAAHRPAVRERGLRMDVAVPPGGRRVVR